MWNGSSNPGSAVAYYCKIGFYHHEGTNMSLCTSKGYWTQPSFSCKGKNVLQNLLVSSLLQNDVGKKNKFENTFSTFFHTLSDNFSTYLYWGHQSSCSSFSLSALSCVIPVHLLHIQKAPHLLLCSCPNKLKPYI